MRIVAGEFRGRRLKTPKREGIRPTADRVREAVFSIIAQHIPGARVLDLFAGTGALGLEALSRGAAQAVFIDRGPEAIQLIRSNIELCGAENRARLMPGSVDRMLRKLASEGASFHVIFMDPPYGKGYIEKTLAALSPVTVPEALVIAEHSAKDVPADECGEWQRTEARRYGDTSVSFYSRDFPR